MNKKQENRKRAVSSLLDYLTPRLNAQWNGRLERNKLLNAYAFESGVSIHTLIEYVNVLKGAGLILMGGQGTDAEISLVDAPALVWVDGRLMIETTGEEDHEA